MTDTRWSLTEYLGRDWSAELVWRELGEEPSANRFEIVGDDGTVRPAQRDPDTRRVGYITDLPAHGIRHYRLQPANASPDSPLTLSIANGVAEVTNAGFGLRLCWEAGSVPATGPVVAVRGIDGIWFGGSSFAATSPAVRDFSSDVIAAGPVFVRLRQRYELVDDSVLTLTYEVDAASPSCRYRQEQRGGATGAIIWHLGRGFEPTRAYWRCHTSPRQPVHPNGGYHRQCFAMRWPAEPEVTELGLMYTHGVNRSNIWAGWDEAKRRDVLVVVPSRPSETRIPAGYDWARHTVVEIAGERRIDLELPLQEGVRPFALAILDREGADLSCEPGPNPANDIDRCAARLMALGLNDYAQMDCAWTDAEPPRFPCIWLTTEELPRLRERFHAWDWLREQFEAHVEDRYFNSHDAEDMRFDNGLPPIGRDLAGAFLVSGDDSYAERARTELLDELDKQVELVIGYSIGNERNIGLYLGLHIPRLALALDAVLGSASFTEVERLAIFRKLVFLAEVVNSENAWPPAESGLARSNPNFNTHAIFGRATLAGMMTGHPKQAEWFASIRGQIAWVLDHDVDDEGSFCEPLTYQIVEIAFFLQCALAMGTSAARPVLEHPKLQKAINFWIDTLTPPDPRCKGARLYPTLGHATSGAYCQSVSVYLALAARLYVTVDLALSRRCMGAWQACGASILDWRNMGSHGNTVWAQPLCFIDRDLTAEPEPVPSVSRSCGQTGAMLRHRHPDTDKEGYLLFKTGKARCHFDADEGSFIWYACGVPLLIDYETQYSPLMDQPWLNNRISIAHKADEKKPGRFLARQFTPEVDYLCSEQVIRRIRAIPEWPRRFRHQLLAYQSAPWEDIRPHRWRRHLLYLKPVAALVIFDELDGDLPTDWSIQVLADHVRTTDTTARFKGQLGVDLAVAFASPAAPDLAVSGFAHLGADEPGKYQEFMRGWHWARPDIGETDVFANRGGEHAVVLRAHAEPGMSYLALLAAYPADGPRPEVTATGNGFAVRTVTGKANVNVDPDGGEWHVTIETENNRSMHRFGGECSATKTNLRDGK